MKISPFIFYSMTLREAKLAIKGHRNEMHEQYILNLYATTNSICSCFGGKKYKMIDPFDNANNKENKSNSNQTSAEDIAFFSAFGIDAKDVAAMKSCQSSDNDDNWDKLSAEEKRKLLFG